MLYDCGQEGTDFHAEPQTAEVLKWLQEPRSDDSTVPAITEVYDVSVPQTSTDNTGLGLASSIFDNSNSAYVEAKKTSGSSSNTSSKSRVRLVECGPLMGIQPKLGQSSNKTGGQHLDWARTPTGQWVRVWSSTAMLPNRQRDKQRVENRLGLPEFGDPATEFYDLATGLPVALGYDRVVYGDHGPYVELSQHQICWSSFPNYVERPHSCFFDEFWTADGLTMLYSQKRHVGNKPNPPKGPLSVQNNRPEGYANYLVGKFYLSCDPEGILVRRPGASQRRKRRTGRGQGSAAGGNASAPREKEEVCGHSELEGGSLATKGSSGDGQPSQGDSQPSQKCQAEVGEVDPSDDACASEDMQLGVDDGCAEEGTVPSAPLETWASDTWDEEAWHTETWCDVEWTTDEWHPRSTVWTGGAWKGCLWTDSSDWWSAGAESWSASASGRSHSRRARGTTSRPPASSHTRWAPKQAHEESTVACSSFEDPTQQQEPPEEGVVTSFSCEDPTEEHRHEAPALEHLHAGEGCA